MILAGSTQAAVARMLRMDRQVVGRHVRKQHVVRGNTAAGPGWARPEPTPEEDELAGRAASAALSVLLAGDAAAVELAQADPRFDWLVDRVAEYQSAR